MKESTEYVMGYAITAYSKRTSSDDPAHVAIHRMCGEAGTIFAPDEAQRFSEAIARASANARGGSR